MSGGASLDGLRVLVTRPAHQAEPLCQKLEAAGAAVMRFPVLAIESLADSEDAQRTARNMLACDLVIFTSPNAVQHGLDALAAAGVDWPSPQAVEVAAIGRATADALEARGVQVAVCPEGPYTSEGLLAHPRLHRVKGQRTMLVRGVGGRELLAETLRERGADVQSLAVYRRVRPQVDALSLTEALLEDELDLAVVTSVEALENLLALAGEEGRAGLLSIGLVTVSGRVATAARVRGFHGGICVAPEASDTGLIEGIRRWRDQQQPVGSSMTDDKHKTDPDTNEQDVPPQGENVNADPPENAGQASGQTQPPEGEAAAVAGADGEPPVEERPPADSPPRDNRPTLILVLLFFLLAIGLVGGWWLYDQQQRLAGEVERKAERTDLAALRDETVSIGERMAGRVDNLAAEHQAHVQQLANAMEATEQLRDTQSRAREQLERVEELAGSQRADWIESEADYLVRVARSRALYHHDVPGALAALRNADHLLEEIGGDGAERRREVRAVIDALVDVPRVDRFGLSADIHDLVDAVDDWPVASVAPRLERRPVEGDRDADLGSVEGWRAAAGRAWSQLRASLASLVVVRREDTPAPLLSPGEEWYLREHIRLQLLTARLALMERDQAGYRSSLLQAAEWTESHFQDNDTVREAVSRMRGLAERDIAPDVPDLDDLLGPGDGGGES